MVHLPVGDLAESLRRVQMEDGRLFEVTHDDAGAAACAAIEDSQGGQLTLAQG